MNGFNQTTVDVGGTDVAVLRGGEGKPLLVLHDELGFPGWMRWNAELARDHELIIPLQPGFGVTERIEWAANYRDIADFYGRLIRSLDLGRVDAIGFSAGGFIAAEMAVSSPSTFDHLVLVAPLGVKPTEGVITDVLAMTIRSHIAATVSKVDAPEFGEIYGGQMSPEQFQLFELARAETSRLGWEPFLYSPSLPDRLGGMGDLPTLLVRGTHDLVLPRSSVEIYHEQIAASELFEIDGVGHRPEIEAPDVFVAKVREFLAGDRAMSQGRV